MRSLATIAIAWVAGGRGAARRGFGRPFAVAKAIAGQEAFETGEGDRVALLGARQFGRDRAHQPRDAGDTLFAAARTGDGRAVGEGAAQHARDRQFAAMGGVDGAHDLGERRAGLGDAEPPPHLWRRRRFVAQRFQQPGHAMAGGRRADHQRHDVALAQFLGEIDEHAVARRLDVADELLHQRVVIVGEPLEHAE